MTISNSYLSNLYEIYIRKEQFPRKPSNYLSIVEYSYEVKFDLQLSINLFHMWQIGAKFIHFIISVRVILSSKRSELNKNSNVLCVIVILHKGLSYFTDYNSSKLT